MVLRTNFKVVEKTYGVVGKFYEVWRVETRRIEVDGSYVFVEYEELELGGERASDRDDALKQAALAQADHNKGR